MRLLLFILIMVSHIFMLAQIVNKPISVSAFNNSTVLPGSSDLGFTSSVIHPGICFGTEFNINSSQKNMLIQTLKIGYFYHRLSEHGIQLYSEFAYRRNFNNRLYISPMIGGGYLHAIPDMEIFEIKDNTGLIKKNNFGRPQAMLILDFETGYHFKNSNYDLFLDYQFWLQMPFVKGYVPVLPNTSFHLGIRYNIFNTTGGNDE